MACLREVNPVIPVLYAVEMALSFEIQELPLWRNDKEKTSKMVEESAKWIECCLREKLPLDEALKPTLDYEFVYRSNVGESVGTQSEEDTRSVLNSLESDSSVFTIHSREERESVNTFNALKAVSRLRDEMDSTGGL